MLSFFLICLMKGYEIKTKLHDKEFNEQAFSSLEEGRSLYLW